MRLQAQKSGTRIELEKAASPGLVVCDRAMVEQVLLNLTRNGIQAMEALPPAASRLLVLRIDAPQRQWVRISVVDGGTGIDADVAGKLFTPFFTTRSEGMGLGLSVCRSIVEQHGGSLAFANLSSAGGSICGAEFSFTLPAVAAPAAAARAAADRAATAATAPGAARSPGSAGAADRTAGNGP